MRWSECDPAGVVFAGTFSLYAHHALEQFRATLFGRPWHEVQRSLGIAVPAKAVNLVFHRALAPAETFDLGVHVLQVGRTTMRFALAARLGREPVFDGELTSICIAPPERKSVPVPAPLRAALESYQRECPHP